jgi:hypothetical protein
LLHLFCPRTLNFDLQGKKMFSRILNKTFYLQFCMRTPKGHQKSSTSSVKKKNQKLICDLSDREIVKKLLKHQIYKSKQKISQKKDGFSLVGPASFENPKLFEIQQKVNTQSTLIVISTHSYSVLVLYLLRTGP